MSNEQNNIITEIDNIPIGITDFSNISGTIKQGESTEIITLQDAIDLLMKMAKFFNYYEEQGQDQS